ncbi:response regulator [bacterium]|nr:response regulator [bacterium]
MAKGNVLIVEDETVFRLIYRGVLENEGFQVIEAEDGKKGWELAKSKHPDLILLDLVLPGLTGYEVLEKVRNHEETKDIPVVVFSVLGESKDIDKAIDLGANYYRTKGIDSPTNIVGIIEDLIDNKESKPE